VNNNPFSLSQLPSPAPFFHFTSNSSSHPVLQEKSPLLLYASVFAANKDESLFLELFFFCAFFFLHETKMSSSWFLSLCEFM